MIRMVKTHKVEIGRRSFAIYQGGCIYDDSVKDKVPKDCWEPYPKPAQPKPKPMNKPKAKTPQPKPPAKPAPKAPEKGK